jgi:hypothetical protein
VKDVLEFRTNQELSSFPDAKDPPERHTLGRLALPTKVVEVRHSLLRAVALRVVA